MSTQTNSFDLMICDLYGRLVYHKIETGNFVSIPAYKIGEGIFVYRLRTNGNNIYNGKVILIE